MASIKHDDLESFPAVRGTVNVSVCYLLVVFSLKKKTQDHYSFHYFLHFCQMSIDAFMLSSDALFQIYV